MPIYMYECPECENVGEYLVSKPGTDTNEPCYKCGYEGELKRSFENSVFAAHTNAANSRSRENEGNLVLMIGIGVLLKSK